jgi:hypothetical protein
MAAKSAGRHWKNEIIAYNMLSGCRICKGRGPYSDTLDNQQTRREDI